MARRSEVGVETLAAGPQRTAGRRRRTRGGHRGPGGGASGCRRGGEKRLKRAEARVREAQEALQQAERALAGQKNDGELCGRRLEEARRQSAELRAREERESGLAGKMASRPGGGRAEDRRPGGGTGSGPGRGAGACRARLERLRENVTGLEQKKAQAGLVEVRLRERCRAREGERERVSGQQRAAVAARWSSWERRTGFLEKYLPLLSELLTAVERLAEHSRVVKTAYEARLEEARAAAEGAARLMRDTAGPETGLQQRIRGHGRPSDRTAGGAGPPSRTGARSWRKSWPSCAAGTWRRGR